MTEPRQFVLYHPGEIPDGTRRGEVDHERVELVVGDVTYRAVAFSDGELRVWDVRTLRPVGHNSVILQPFHSPEARAASVQQTGPDREDLG